MHHVRVVILAIGTVFAWAFATRLIPNGVWNFGWLPPDAWRIGAETLMGAVLGYPLAHALGVRDAIYARVALVVLIVAPVVETASAERPDRGWMTAAILLCAIGGMLVKKARHHSRT